MYDIVESKTNGIEEFAGGGIIRDETIHLKLTDRNQFFKARLITYKDPLTGHVLKFLSNLFLYQATTITSLYKNRWSMEVNHLTHLWQGFRELSDPPEPFEI